MCDFIPYKWGVLLQQLYETFSDLGIIYDKTSKEVEIPLKDLKLLDGMRRRQIYYRLNFQRIHLNTFVRNNEPDQYTWLDTENALVGIQVNFVVSTSQKSNVSDLGDRSSC